MKPQETIDFHLRWTWHKISRLYNLEASRRGFSMSTGYALLNIDQSDGTPSTKLGPKMGMEPRSLTRTLKSMEEEGLIKRVPDKKDKRKVNIILTPFGKKMRKISRDTVLKFNQKIKEEIPVDKLDTFFEVMGLINTQIDKSDIFESPKKDTIQHHEKKN